LALILNQQKNVKQLKKWNNKDGSNDYNKNLILNNVKNLNGNNKIYLYQFLKQNGNEMEYYLSHPDRNVRLILTKFRLSDHKLLIEIGRYLKIPRDQWLCAICNVLGDEFYFFFWMQEKYQYSKHFIPILSKYIFKFSWIKPWREIKKNKCAGSVRLSNHVTHYGPRIGFPSYNLTIPPPRRLLYQPLG